MTPVARPFGPGIFATAQAQTPGIFDESPPDGYKHMSDEQVIAFQVAFKCKPWELQDKAVTYVGSDTPYGSLAESEHIWQHSAQSPPSPMDPFGPIYNPDSGLPQMAESMYRCRL